MRYVFILFIALFAASCGTEAEPEDVFEEYKIGSWMMTSETSAEWQGDNTAHKFTNNSHTDTLVFDSPDNTALFLEAGDDDGWTDLIVIDSTMTEVLPFEMKVDRMQSLGYGGISTNVYDDHTKVTVELGIGCTQSIEETDTIQMIWGEIEDPVLVYDFRAYGFSTTFFEIHCP